MKFEAGKGKKRGKGEFNEYDLNNPNMTLLNPSNIIASRFFFSSHHLFLICMISWLGSRDFYQAQLFSMSSSKVGSCSSSSH